MSLFVLVNIFAFSIIIFSFLDLNLAVAIYVAYQILVPGMMVNFAGISFSYNVINLLLLMMFLLHFCKKEERKLNFEVISPFLFLFIALLALTLVQWETPWEWQFNYWRGSFMQVCILSFIIWNRGIQEPKMLNYICWALFISFIISGIYGIYLMQLDGENQYASEMSEYFGIRDAVDFYSKSNDPRLGFSNAEKIQSTMAHPMTWALCLCFFFVLILTLIQKFNNIFYWLFLAFISFSILISGVRTAIAAMVIGVFYYLIRLKNFKLIALALGVIFCTTIIIVLNKDLSNIFTSFIDVSGRKSNVSGSSISMRLDQFNGALKEMEGHELFGKGYEWTSYYMEKIGDHPVLLDFESLIFVILCNSGIAGIFIWMTFFTSLFRTHRRLLYKRHSIYLLDTIVIVYLSYSIGTGEYGYLVFFSIFYSLLFTILYVQQNSPYSISLLQRKENSNLI